MPNKIQIKRTTVTGRTPNTTNSGNSQFIDTGELALNLTDGKMFSSNGTVYFEVGSNLNSIAVGGTFTANATSANLLVNTTISAIIANGSIGTSGQVLTSNATGIYWSTVSGGGGGSVTKYSANIGNGSATSITVNHNLNSDNVFVTVIENSTGYYVYPDIKYSTSNSTIFEFVDAPTTDQYKVIVL